MPSNAIYARGLGRTDQFVIFIVYFTNVEQRNFYRFK